MSELPRIDSLEPKSGAVLLYGGTVLTMDGDARVVRDAEVLLDRGRVAAVGRALTVFPGTRLVDVQGCLVLPGLIQGHVHLGQTFFRGLAEQRHLLQWLGDRIWPLEAAHDDESAYWCALLGAAECLLSGTTTVQDIGLGPGAKGLLQGLADSGLRAIAGMCLMDTGEGVPDALLQDTDRALAETEGLGAAFEDDDGRLSYSINPRFILSCSDALWQGAQALARRRSWPMHTHGLEHQAETAAVRASKGGRDEIDYFDEVGVLEADLRLAHGVWVEEGHHERLKRHRTSVVHCPSSNLKLGSGIADVMGLRQAGIAVGIGCDGTACSNGLDAFEEMRLAALLQKVRHGPEVMSGVEALRLGTSEGAQALGLQEEIGSLDVGKRADVVVLDGSGPDLWGSSVADPHDLVAFGASRTNVRHVFVEGEHLVEDGRLTCLDIDEIRRQADRCVDAVVQRSGLDL